MTTDSWQVPTLNIDVHICCAFDHCKSFRKSWSCLGKLSRLTQHWLKRHSWLSSDSRQLPRLNSDSTHVPKFRCWLNSDSAQEVKNCNRLHSNWLTWVRVESNCWLNSWVDTTLIMTTLQSPQSGRGGGVTIFVSNDIPHYRILLQSTLKAVVCFVRVQNRRIECVVFTYLPPTNTFTFQ